MANATSFSSLADRSGQSLNIGRDGDRCLQLFIFNEEFFVNARHQRALNTSLLFVHTARRTYRLDDPVKSLDSWYFFVLIGS